MAMLHEFERHINAARESNNEQGVKAIEALKAQFEVFASQGIVPVLPREELAALKIGGEVDFNIAEVQDFSFGQTLKHFREKAMLSQEELSRGSGRSVVSISRVENGHCIPNSYSSLQRIINGLGWNEDDPRAEFFTGKFNQEKLDRRMNRRKQGLNK